ncbi:MAG TPA: sensor histidine kinase [Xanthobacteraceae bacterium]|nr:sensor histidine kinase [Xanthobacteraceae bacterium]
MLYVGKPGSTHAVRRTLSLPLRLAVLVAGTALPLIVFSAAIVFLNYYGDRETAAERVLETARSMRLVLDRELQSAISALRVLALSPALQRGDLTAFRAEAETFAQQYPDAPNVLLTDRSGQQLLNLRVPPGEPLPKRAGATIVEQIFSTGRPVVSDLYTGSVSGRLIVTADVPVFKGGRVAYDLTFTLPFQTFRSIIAQQRPSDEWVISIFDGSGHNVARLPGAEEYLGASASATLLPYLRSSSEMVLETTSLEQTRLLTAIAHSQLSGWSVAVGMPTSSLTEPLWRTLLLTLVIGTILLAVGLGFSVRMATRIARAEAHRDLLINELNHRVKNTLAIVQSIAARTFRDAAPTDARAAFEARLMALARAHNILSEESWEKADLRTLVLRALEPHVAAEDARLRIAGPDVRLKPQTALAVAMVLHELATNAAKYGALTRPTGRVHVDWRLSGAEPKRRLAVHWREAGGPPVAEPARKGFGFTLIERGIGQELGGTAALTFAPGGVECTLEFPLA